VFTRGCASILDSIYLASEHPSDFTIQYPPRREYFKESFRNPAHPKYFDEILKNDPISFSTDYQRKLLLYCHIPFCEHKCFYCNFSVDTRSNQHNLHDIYIDTMIQGLEALNGYVSQDKHAFQLRGIDIGGGTPTILSAENLQKFLAALKPLRDKCDHSYPLSIETTPAIASKYLDRLEALKAGGVDRVSMGMQSTDDALLEFMNRGKEATLSTKAVRNLQSIGFKRLSVDIIFGLPNQQLKHWQNDLEQIVELGVDVVTTYDCLYRGKGRAMTKKTSYIPSMEEYGKLYDYGYNFLTRNGFHAPYGSVNFSRIPNETGTSAYFEGRLLDGLQFLGLGNYATSVFAGSWWFAPYHVDQWLFDIDQRKTWLAKNSVNPSSAERLGVFMPVSDCYSLPMEEFAAKYALFSLSFGVLDPRRFVHIFNCELEEVYYDSLKYALAQGWLWKNSSDNCYYITPGQFKNMPLIRSLFYTRSAINWLKSIQADPSLQYRHRKSSPPQQVQQIN